MVVICRVPLVIDSGIYGAFGELPCMSAFQQTCSDKQRERTGFILRKQVYRLLIKIIILLVLLLLLKHSAPVSMVWNL